MTPSSPYIATVPRLGYRMVARVSPWADSSITDRPIEDQSIVQVGSSRASDSEHPATPDAPTPALRLRTGPTWAASAALCLALVVAFLFAFQFRGRVAKN